MEWWSRSSGWKLPLHIKLMVSYVLVVGLIMGPTLVYVRTKLSQDETDRARVEMQLEVRAVATRFERIEAHELRARTELLLLALPNRLTVVDARGEVLGDSARPGQPSPNHADRPEIQQAFRDGEASSVRRSVTTGEMSLYVARRFPSAGPVLGVVRLSRPMAVIDAARDDVTQILRNAAAAALTAAVLLSLVAAFVASRPLRRIAHAARLLSEGEFGINLDVNTHDEIGDVAQAIVRLAAQLKSKLLASGADRATLQALLDDLPVGVVLYDSLNQPDRINEAARRMVDLTPHLEVARGAEIPRLAGQRAAVERVLRDGVSETQRIDLPWKSDASLLATWLAVFDAEGNRTLGLVLSDRTTEQALREVRATLSKLPARLREAGRVARGHRSAADFVREAEALEATLPIVPLEGDRVSGASLRGLIEEALHNAAPLLEASATVVDTEAPEGDWKVAEGDGRVARALRAMVVHVGDAVPSGSRLTMKIAPTDASVRLSLVGPFSSSVTLATELSLVRPLGGDGGIIEGEERREAWLSLPKA